MPRSYFLYLYIFLLSQSIITSGCTHHLQMSGVLPSGASVSEIGNCDATAPFDLDMKGENIVFADGGLKIQNLISGRSRMICPDTPSALAWSPDGRRIAAAFSRENEGALRLYGFEGELQAEVKVSGNISSIAWRSTTEVLAMNIRVTHFSFGANITEALLQWDGVSDPKRLIFFDNTLKPSTVKQGKDYLIGRLTFKLSPLGDEVLFVNVIDPPLYPTYFRIMLHNIDSGKAREIAKVSLDSGGGAFLGAGESILFGDGEHQSQISDPWKDIILRTIPTPGREVAVSSGGRYMMLDGNLYFEGTRTASFQESCRSSFSGFGGHMAVECGDRLYLVSGLKEDLPAQFQSKEIARIKELHKLLSEGLITHQDYRRSLEKAAR
jgi:hypothetical protein